MPQPVSLIPLHSAASVARRALIVSIGLSLGLVACGGGDSGGGDNAGAGGSTAGAGGQGGAQTSDAGSDVAQGGASGHDAATGGSAGSSSNDGGLDGGEDASPPDTGVDAHIGCPQVGDTKCSGNTVVACVDDGSGGRDWQTKEFCPVDTSECKVTGNVASCEALPTCKDGTKNQDETDIDCGGTHCDKCAASKMCGVDGDCESDACSSGVCAVCKAGVGGCDGNLVQQCKSDQSGWTTLKTCNGLGGQMCDAATKKCIATPVIGNTTVTGDYYLYTIFSAAAGAPWKTGGFDVDSYVDTSTNPPTNWIFVNRGRTLDVYTVTIEDSDKDGVIEPNQHPDNPKKKGPIEKRTLHFKASYAAAQIGAPSQAEIYAASPTLVYFGNGNGNVTGDGDLYSFDLTTKTRKKLFDAPNFAVDLLGRDETTGTWYGTNEWNRRLYRYFPGQGWVPQFGVPFFSPNHGSNDHLDGLEVVVNPKDGITYYYFSDMISNFISQYYWDKSTKKWVQKNLFKYQDSNAGYVEGMGFGAFNHFWVANGTNLYELGGGKLQDFVEPS